MFTSLIDFAYGNQTALVVVGLCFVALLLFVLIRGQSNREPPARAEAPPAKPQAAPPSATPAPASESAAPEFEPLAPPRRVEEIRVPAPMRDMQPARAERAEAPAPTLEAPVPIGAERSDHYVVTVHFGTDRKDAGSSQSIKDRFLDERARPPPGSSRITYGACEVAIPKLHKIGELEAPGWFRSEQPGQHVMLLSLKTSDRTTFLGNLAKAMKDEKSVFVFVHGFSTSFEDAARRTAQMAFDMKFRGAPIFFDWPTSSMGATNLNAYTESENNARWATEHFRSFLLDVVRESGAKTVHLIAHSMGNRIVTDALMELYWVLTPAEKSIIGEVVLTAPDIDADVFVDQIAPRITAMNSRVTLYASTKDTALATSKGVHGYPRAGDFAALTKFPEKVEVVDASDVDTDVLGHSYYGNAQSVISDICHLITGRSPAGQRTVTLAALSSAHGTRFWRVRKESTLEQVWAALTGRQNPIA